MATLSVRQIAQNCLGVTGDISVNTHVYGYIFRDADGSVFGTLSASDTLPGSGAATTRSLKRHLQTVSGKATDLVIILVSHENDFSGVVTRNQATKAQYAIQIARDIYAQRNLGIRTIRWQRIPVADAGGYANIADRGEAEDLTDDWSSSGGGIDVFMVQTIGDAAGWSNVDGPCSKESKFDLSGVVLELSLGRRFTGVLLAHEVGHYLGRHPANSGDESDGRGLGRRRNRRDQQQQHAGHEQPRHEDALALLRARAMFRTIMPSKSTPRLSPKVIELVATDRLARPPVGRLSGVQAGQLAAVAQRRQAFELDVSPARAIRALSEGAKAEVALPVLEAVLADRKAPLPERVAAARGLGHIATPAAERALLSQVRAGGIRACSKRSLPRSDGSPVYRRDASSASSRHLPCDVSPMGVCQGAHRTSSWTRRTVPGRVAVRRALAWPAGADGVLHRAYQDRKGHEDRPRQAARRSSTASASRTAATRSSAGPRNGRFSSTAS